MSQNIELAKAIIIAYLKNIFSTRDFDALSAMSDIDSNNISKLREHFTYCRDLFDNALKDLEKGEENE